MNNKQLEERFDILNYKYEKTGKVGNRYEPLNPGEYRAIVHLCIFNSKGEMLIQRRNRNKNTWPNRWDITCGGAVISGETVSEAMERELYEELGLKHSFVNERPCISVHYYEGVDEKVATAIDKACKKYNMDPSFIMAVIKQESNFNSNAVSSAGATGIMQIMPFNFAGLGITDPYDVEQNIDGGTKMLSNLLDVYQDKKMALAAYNAGSGTLANRNINGEEDFDRLPSETQDYIKKVSAYEEMYNNKYV